MFRQRNLFLNNDCKLLKLHHIAQNLDIFDAGIKTNAEILECPAYRRDASTGLNDAGIKRILSFF
jgi:hypothetical protein